jgi:2-hydroxy-3-keto-5-methylthiopentenyl-1-phosphate phosphatase
VKNASRMLQSAVRTNIPMLAGANGDVTVRPEEKEERGARDVIVRSLLVDFDGTACVADVASELCGRFAPPGWQRYDESTRNGELTLREAIDHQTRLLTGSREEMLGFVLDSFVIDPGFVTLTAWADQQHIAIAVVSDGFGFYIQPMLAAVGLADLPVLANSLVHRRGAWQLEHPHGRADCIGCGTCKMLAVLHYRTRVGPVAFVGEGESDKYAALYADAVFAKLRLAEICLRDGVDHSEWKTFDDVRAGLSRNEGLPGRGAPAVCPGCTPQTRDVVRR